LPSSYVNVEGAGRAYARLYGLLDDRGPNDAGSAHLQPDGKIIDRLITQLPFKIGRGDDTITDE
jgi:hypothetical protein